MPNPINPFVGWPVPPLVAPRNAPPDDLSSYLALWNSQAAAYVESQAGPDHGEWDVNTRIPRMRNLRGLAAFFGVGDRLDFDGASYDYPNPATPYRLGDIRIVPTFWAQRGLNAAGISTVTDGVSGPNTLAGLRAFKTRFRLEGAAPAIYDRTHISMSKEMEQALASLTQVADVSASTPATPAPAPLPTPAPSSGSSAAPLLIAIGLGVAGAVYFGRNR